MPISWTSIMNGGKSGTCTGSHRFPILNSTAFIDCQRMNVVQFRRNAKHWVYPEGVPERAYQIEIIQTALLQNTLVCLPTGLGKTLIAAVVMHNFMRWFPEVLSVFSIGHASQNSHFTLVLSSIHGAQPN